MSENNGKNTGRIEEIQGVVVDVVFPDKLPEIYSAVEIQVEESDAREGASLICETCGARAGHSPGDMTG